MIGTKDAQNGNLVAGLELRAADAIFPGLEGERAALDDVETDPVEKIYNIGESKDGIELVLFSLQNQGFDQFTSDALCLGILVHRQGADFGGGGTVEIQGSAAQQLSIEGDYGEIAD